MTISNNKKSTSVLRGAPMQRFAMAPLALAIANLILPSTSFADEEHKTIEEITVTATKRAIDLQSVAQSITAFSGDTIETMGITSMSDYINALPSVTLTANQPGRNSLAMRGISSGSAEYYTDGQVAVYLDDIPMTTNSQQVSVRPIDMERVESLHGPQGTLYGSSSQTGTIRLITNKPNNDAFSGGIEASYGATGGGDDSYDLNGHINVPLIEDVLAMRAVLYSSEDGGYVDNVAGASLSGNHRNDDPGYNVVDENQNKYGTTGGRIAFALDLNENWNALLTVVAENSELDGTWETDPLLGDHKVTRFIDENREDEWYATALTVEGDLGFANLTVSASHFERDIAYNWDNDAYTQYKDRYYGNGYNAYGYYYGLYNTDYNRSFVFNDQSQERDTVEIRLVSQSDSRLQWTAGLFYEDVYDEWFYGTSNENLGDTTAWAYAQNYAYYYGVANYYNNYTPNPNQAYPLPDSDYGYLNIFDRSVKQTAVFAEVSYDITNALTLTGGYRWAEFDRNEVDFTYYPDGLLTAGLADGGDGATRSQGKDDDAIYKVSLDYRINEDVMVYGLYSQGFRLGGSNSPRAVATGEVPATYSSDTLDNYELGIKSQWWDNRIKFNATLFKMEWSDYQQSTTFGQWWNRGTLNAGDAEITGIELDVAVQATDNLKFNLSLFSADAQFKDDIYFSATADPATDARSIRGGMDLPSSPDLKGHISVYYDIDDVLGGDAWIYFDTSYQSETWNGTSDITINNKNGLSDTYTVSNLSFGLDLSDGLNVTLMINNVFDDNDSTYVSTSPNDYADLFGDNRFHNEQTLERPRTTWLTVRKAF
jgi:iron complex outermembrane receptor protein